MAQEGTERFVRIQSRCDTTENWEFYNPILAKNEVGYDTTNKSYKIGDGETSWLNLSYSTAGMIKGNGEVFNDYENNYADGEYSHAEGYSTSAKGNMSHTGGISSIAEGEFSFSHGTTTKTISNGAVAFSNGSLAGSKGFRLIALSGSAGGVGTYTLAEDTDINELNKLKSAFDKAVADNVPLIYSVQGNAYAGQQGAITNIDIENKIITVDNFADVGMGAANSSWKNVFFVDSCPEIGDTTKGSSYAFSEGWGSEALKAGSHAENSSYAYGIFAHAEGMNAESNGYGTHAEGGNTMAKDYYSHVEGEFSRATGRSAHAEGNQTHSTARASHAEGELTQATGMRAHAEGFDTDATAMASHSEGRKTQATNEASHAEGYLSVASGYASHAEGQNTEATKIASHSEGLNTHAIGDSSHAEGNGTTAEGINSHVEGGSTHAKGNNSHAEGQGTYTEGYASHAEGQGAQAIGGMSHAEGERSKASGQGSHAEGLETQATSSYTHAEGEKSVASGYASHAEGHSSASAAFAHSEGTGKATKNYSHAEGAAAQANGVASHAEGFNTIANADYQHVQGKFNKPDTSSLFIIGNGEDANSRSNAMMVDWNGNLKIAGQLQDMNGTSILPFVEKEVTIHASDGTYKPNNYWWPSPTDEIGGMVATTTMEILFSSLEEAQNCDFRIPPITIPYSNDNHGVPLPFEEQFKDIEFANIGYNDQENTFKIDLTWTNKPDQREFLCYFDTTWKILFWRKTI